MRVDRILGQIWAECREQVHLVRMRAVEAAVQGLLRGGRLSLTAMGRGIRGRARPKHSIKRMDRLLSNQHLYRDRSTFFRGIGMQLLAGISRPIVLIDWTELVGDFHALVAGVPMSGRALPLYAEVYEEKFLGNSKVEARFLRTLQAILPPGCRPIVVTDAGFRGPFFSAVTDLGWDFVGRLRGCVSMQHCDGLVTTKAALYRLATSTPKDRGFFRLFLSRRGAGQRPIPARLVLYYRRRKSRVCRTSLLTSHAKRKAAKGAKEPWLLATSLPSFSPAQIVGVYKKRMQIEETFRDTKNHRWGWSLRDARCGRAERLTALLLIASLTLIAVSIIGHAAEQSGIHRRFQANTSRERVLSLFVLGCHVIASQDQQRLIDASTIDGPHQLRRVLTLASIP